jgi:hypothetical protein
VAGEASPRTTISPGAGARRASGGSAAVVAVVVALPDEPLPPPQAASAATAMGRKNRQTGRYGIRRTIFSCLGNT